MPAEVALVALVRDGRVLLAHRRADKAHAPDCWDLVGGMVEPGETPIDAAARECREELGVAVVDLRAFRGSYAGEGVVFYTYLTQSWSGDPANCAPHEHDELRWVPLREVNTLTLATPALGTDLRAALGVL